MKPEKEAVVKVLGEMSQVPPEKRKELVARKIRMAQVRKKMSPTRYLPKTAQLNDRSL